MLENAVKSKNYKIEAIFDDNKKYFKKKYKGIPINIGLENAKKYKNSLFVFGIGSYGNKNNRNKLNIIFNFFFILFYFLKYFNFIKS